MSNNGRLSKKELTRIYDPQHEVYLADQAAAAFNTLRIWSVKWLKTEITVTGPNSAYRTYASQQYFWDLYRSGKGNLAAVPGTSNHGWGNAVDVPSYAAQQVIHKFGHKVGWKKIEAWSEPWHFNYVGGFSRPNPGTDAKYPVARLGSGGWGQGWYVKKLERRLKKLGYKKIKVDKHFGKVTDRAVRNFQKLTGLKVDGVVGKKTWVKLWKVSKKDLNRLRNKQAKKPNSKNGQGGLTVPAPTPAPKPEPVKPEVRRTSAKGIELIKHFEGFPNMGRPYNDPLGHATVGYGHLLHKGPVRNRDLTGVWIEGQRTPGELTQAEALKLLKKRLNEVYEPPVRKLFRKGGLLEGKFTQARFDALVGFVFNLGPAALEGGNGFETIGKHVKAGKINKIANSLTLYRNRGTSAEVGLVRRRLTERRLILKGDYTPYTEKQAEEWIAKQ